MSVEKRQLASGTRYLVRWRENTKLRSRTFVRKRDAEAFEHEILRRQQLGLLAVQQLTSKGPTLDEWTATKWAVEHAATLAPRTRETYAAIYGKHLSPYLGERPLRELRVSALREWQADRLQAGVGRGALMHARAVLSSILRHAAEAEVIAANPMSLVRAPKAPPKEEVRPVAPSGVEAIRREMGPRDATLVSVLAYAGLRPGEALALKWSQVGERTLTVNASKTGRRRSVKLLQPLAQDLREWRLLSGRPAKSALVFPAADGGPWTTEAYKDWSRPESGARKKTNPRKPSRIAGAFHRAVENGDVDCGRPYDLRHSFASLLLAEGRTIHYVAAQLGHGPDLTLKVYGHLFAEFDDAPRIDAEAEIRKARTALGSAETSGDGERARSI